MATTPNQPTNDAQIDAILSVLSRHPTVRLAILFGSIASGRARAGSDLDLAVDAGQRLDAEEKIALISELAAEIGRPVDLVDLSAVGEPLLGQILKNGKKILGSSPHLAELISRHVFNQTDFLPYRNRILAERRKSWIGQ